MSNSYELITGTKMWSSWSLRPWILMRQFALPFDEIVIALRTPHTASAIIAQSPSGKIPALRDGALTVWDSLAIIEYLAERHPERAIWPRNGQARAVARSVSAEMHSGFQALRQNCPMDFNARGLTPTDPAAIEADVARIVEIWRDCRARFGADGPFLFGPFSAADAMYAPVVSRFVSYGLAPAEADAADAVAPYMAAVQALPAWTQWAHEAQQLSDAHQT
jgi:glutathione S-transferase